MKNGRKRFASLLIGGILAVSSAIVTLPLSAEESVFAFDGSMSEETLRAYCSRAVSFAGFCVENCDPDPIFEEDLRMVLRTGAKYIGRAAYYSWGGNMSAEQIGTHYRLAEERAAEAHRADPELILQAGVFEIVYRGTAEATPVPAYAFEAFGLPVEERNFSYDDIVFTEGEYDVKKNYWGNDSSGVPDITKTETQLYFYTQITRYIDAGYEAFHLGQAELMANYDPGRYPAWDRVTTLAREYAKDHARRGIVLFDCHTNIASGGMKVGDRLICDIIGAGLVPNETEFAGGAYQCRISHYDDCWLQWIGRSAGGKHPLGFTVDACYTILEFDNYGGSGNPGVPTPDGFYNWGWDDITWFAMQPEQYRNDFLLECQDFLTSECLDKNGEQVYYLQPAFRRVLTDIPELTYELKDPDAASAAEAYLKAERTEFTREGKTLTMKVTKDYRANMPSDVCPNGFGQEDTVREIFLGKNAPDPAVYREYLKKAETEAVSAQESETGKAAENPSADKKPITAILGISAAALGVLALSVILIRRKKKETDPKAH